MIKRCFYRQEHGDKSAAAASSSSSLSSDSASESDEELEAQEEDAAAEGQEEAEAIGASKGADGGDDKEHEREHRLPSSGSGYESEASSGNDIEGDSSGLLAAEEADVSDSVYGNLKVSQLDDGVKAKDSKKVKTGSSSADINECIQADFANYILKHKSVFKCRICPRIVCLSEDTVKEHLKSKACSIQEIVRRREAQTNAEQ